MKKNTITGPPYIQKIEVAFASLLDVSSVVVIPSNPSDTLREDKNTYPCIFFDPCRGTFLERKGMRIRLQDTFPNIRENRHLAWVCADFAKYVFMKIDEKLTMRVIHTRAANELITRVYSTDAENLRSFARVYEPDSPERYRRHMDIVTHQTENFGEVCINDILQNYSEWVIERRRDIVSGAHPLSL